MKVRFTHEILGADFYFEAVFVCVAGIDELSSIIIHNMKWEPSVNIGMSDLQDIYIKTGEHMVSLKAILTDRAFDELTTLQDGNGFPQQVA